jgi:hypothetical protein
VACAYDVPDGEVTDELSQISYTEAKAIDEAYEVGEECYQQLTLEDFGRRSIMAARQTLFLGSWISKRMMYISDIWIEWAILW